MTYAQSALFEIYKDWRLDSVTAHFHNGHVRRLISTVTGTKAGQTAATGTLLDTPLKDTFRWAITRRNELGNLPAKGVDVNKGNWNKLNKKKMIVMGNHKRLWSMTYRPKYDQKYNGGWFSWQNNTNYGDYNSLWNRYHNKFQSFCTDFCKNDTMTIPTTGGLKKNRYYPRLYFNCEAEFGAAVFDNDRNTHLKEVQHHTNFEVTWPRIHQPFLRIILDLNSRMNFENHSYKCYFTIKLYQ